MTGNSLWIWLVPIIFAIVLAVVLVLAFFGDHLRRRYQGDLPTKTRRGTFQTRGPVMGGTVDGSPGQRNRRDRDTRVEIDEREDEPNP